MREINRRRFSQRARAAFRGTAWRWSASLKSFPKVVIRVKKKAREDERMRFGQMQRHVMIKDFPLNQTPETSDSLLIALLILFKTCWCKCAQPVSDVIPA